MDRRLAFAVAFSVVLPAARAQGGDDRLRLVAKDLSSPQAIDPAIEGQSLVASPDGATVAYPAKRGKKVVVVVEGKAGAEYDQVGTIHMGENGRGVSHWAKKGDAWVVVVDGAEREVKGGPLNVVEGIAVSPDGSRVAYVVKRGPKFVMVADAKEGPEYDGVGWPLFSPDGKRLAYSARRGGKHVVVVDGAEGSEFDGLGGGEKQFLFSPDSKRLGYTAERGGRWFAVIEGAEGKPFDQVRTIAFPAAGPRVAHVARTPEGERVVLDGVPGEPWHIVSDLAFSPDGKRLAASVRRAFRTPKDQTWFVLVDGAAGKESSLVGQRLLWSADSKHLAYAARRGENWVAVLDDVFGPTTDQNMARSLSISPDGSRIAYAAKRAATFLLVVGGKETGPFESVASGSPRFGPDGAHVASFVRQAGVTRLLLDDAQSDPLEGAVGSPVFDGPNAVKAIVVRDGKLVRVRFELPAAVK